MARPEKHVFVCSHSRPEGHPKGSCAARGAQGVIDAFADAFETRDLWGRFKLTATGCLGTCEQGPSVLVYPQGVMYQKVSAGDVKVIIDEHLIGEEPVERLQAPPEVWG